MTTKREAVLFERLEAGNARFSEGDHAAAAEVYELLTADLTPDDHAFGPPLYENLGLARWFQGRFAAAERAFLRALDGDPSSREQSLRFAVLCAFRRKRPYDARRRLETYVQHFGDHPSGWTAEFMDAAVQQWRRDMRRALPC